MRGELAHGRIGRPRQIGRHYGRERRYDMDRFVGQRLQRGPPQDAVGLLNRGRADQYDRLVDGDRPFWRRRGCGFEHAGADEMHRVAPSGMRILERLTPDRQQQRRPPEERVDRSDLGHTQFGSEWH